MAINMVTSQPPEWRPTGTLTERERERGLPKNVDVKIVVVSVIAVMMLHPPPKEGKMMKS